MRVFLDDDRNHFQDGWIHVRTVPALMRLVAAHGPEIVEISFDNDLRQVEEGWMAVRDLAEIKLDDSTLLPALRTVSVHSANTGGAENMLGRLRNMARAGLFDIEVHQRSATNGFHYPIDSEDTRGVEIYR